MYISNHQNQERGTKRPFMHEPLMAYEAYRVRVLLDGRIVGAYVEESVEKAQKVFWNQVDTYRSLVGNRATFELEGLVRRGDSWGDRLLNW